jgi:hypothetical protein
MSKVEKLNDFAFRELLGHGSVDANTIIYIQLYLEVIVGHFPLLNKK